MAELTQAMGINKPSLYAVFGNKEELFARALERYEAAAEEHLATVLDKPTLYEILESYLRSVAESSTSGRVPGCLSLQGGLSCAPANARIPQLLADYRVGLEQRVAEALSGTEEAHRDARAIDIAALADYAVTVGIGLSVHAAAGATQKRLDVIVDVALAGLALLLTDNGSHDSVSGRADGPAQPMSARRGPARSRSAS